MRSPSTSNSGSTKYSRSMQATWLGDTFISDAADSSRKSEQLHSLTRAQDTINVLFNPSIKRVKAASSLLTCGGLFGMNNKLTALTAQPKRKVEDLPEIHYVLISNSDLDQLDTVTILGLHKRDSSRFVVTKGGASSLLKLGIPEYQITELSSWEEESFQVSQSSNLRITSVPIEPSGQVKQKKSKASVTSHWIVKHENNISEKVENEEPTQNTVLFASSTTRKAHVEGYGNTSLTELWKKVQAKYGPIDLAFIPVWAGKQSTSSGFLKRIFSSNTSKLLQDYAPVEAAQVHQALRSGLSIAMLHGLEGRSLSPFSDDDLSSDDDNEPGHASSSSVTRSAQAQAAIAQLKSACDRTERRSVEFRRAASSGSFKKVQRRTASQNRSGKKGKSTFAVLSEGQTVSV